MSSAERIELLSDTVISKIAAGEVVERPASVAKELIENAIDSGARSIALEYFDEDRPRLVLTDDGAGIASDQVELALTRHATSKLRSMEDLSSIATLGFRGEALASIAAVADVELTTRTAASEEAVRIHVRGGKVLDFSAAGFSPGTRVDVRDLFSEVPARQKFLKAASTEFGLVADCIRRFALGYPQLGFRLSRNARVSASFPAVAGLRERVTQVLGTSLRLIEVDAAHDGLRLHGFAGAPGESHGSNRWASIFVNGRWVRDRLLFRALMDAYKTYLLKGRYPAAALFLEIGADAVDVNVHPAKTEVRFADPARVSGFVVEAVREALRSGASPLGRWGETAARVEKAELVYRARGPAAVAREPEAASTVQPRLREALSGYRGPSHAGPQQQSEPEQLPLAAETQAPRGGFAGVEVLGQVFRGYLVCDDGNDLVLVDQHALHERVLFERLRNAYAEGSVESQALLVSVPVSLPEADTEALALANELLAALGWEIEALAPGQVMVRAVPALAAKLDPKAALEAIASDLADHGRAAAAEAQVERVLATVACHAAIRVGKTLDRTQSRALLAEAASVEFSAACPHGRPVARSLSRAKVERLFGR